ncbi:MAG: PAS domain S-box protein [Candidatus Hermodarchaeota archaeon]
MNSEQNLKEETEIDWNPSEEYKLLINHAPLGIFLADRKGNIKLANKALIDILGSPSIEATKQVNVLTFSLLQDAGISATIQDCLDTGESSVNEFFYRTKWGKSIYCRLYLNATMDFKNHIVGIQGIVEDISKWKQLNDKLKKSEENYKNLIENALEGVWAVDENDNTVLVNPKLCEMLGYSKNELMSSNLHNFLNKSMSEYVNSFIPRRKEGFGDTYELDFIKKDGTILKTRVNAAPILNEEGSLKGTFAYITDITQQKLAEQQLIESESKFRRIFESIPDLFFLVDNDTTIIDYKGREENLYMLPEEFLGKKLVGVMPSDIRELLLKTIKDTISSQQPQIMEYSLPIDKKVRDFEARFLFFSENRVAIFVREITDRKKAMKIIEREIEKLKELDQIRKDLIIRISHELKTPLVSISGGTELLLSLFKDKLSLDEKEVLEIIQKGGDRLKRLIDNLVDVTRIEYNKLKLRLKETDIVELLKDCANEMMYLIKKRELTLKFMLPDRLLLKIDKIRLEQVIINLLSNAIKNTPPDGTITIRAYTKGDYVTISVSDSGIGLTKEEIQRLFSRFGKIERYGSGLEYIDIQGTGLGLFISKEIIELHKGEIWAESLGRNQGSTFIIKLPI